MSKTLSVILEKLAQLSHESSSLTTRIAELTSEAATMLAQEMRAQPVNEDNPGDIDAAAELDRFDAANGGRVPR